MNGISLASRGRFNSSMIAPIFCTKDQKSLGLIFSRKSLSLFYRGPKLLNMARFSLPIVAAVLN
jgi:hypothetical protein